MNERCQRVFNYRSYLLIHKSQQYDDDVASEMQKMRKKAAVQMRSKAFNGKNAIFQP